MSRKDYQLIAAALRENRPTSPESGKFMDGYTAAWQNTCNSIMDALARDNPRFSRATFRAACGLTNISEVA